ncbi:MAG: hypothetical protein D6702_00025 [Planctomycetota bacterium]|nr:MAG: hypothetical protein D6702_00025 [Planctomycetota bacterium]
MLVPALPADPPWDLDLVVLGFGCYVLTGAFMYASIGRGRPSYRLQVIFGTAASSLRPLRDAIHAKVLAQVASVFFAGGSVLLALGFLRPGPADLSFQLLGGGVLLAVGVLCLVFVDPYVSRVLRRVLRRHLRTHPFDFEGNIALARDIGDLFGVPTAPDDTLAVYVARLREALGIDEPPSRLFGRGGRRW